MLIGNFSRKPYFPKKLSKKTLYLFFINKNLLTFASLLCVKTTGEAPESIEAGEILFMAGLVFVIAQIFKRGVEMQAENELTV